MAERFLHMHVSTEMTEPNEIGLKHTKVSFIFETVEVDTEKKTINPVTEQVVAELHVPEFSKKEDMIEGLGSAFMHLAKVISDGQITNEVKYYGGDTKKVH
jgi:hypothetical protein